MGSAPSSSLVDETSGLSPADKKCELFKSYADFCGIRQDLINQLTESDFSDLIRLMNFWKPRFSVVIQRITDLLELLKKIEQKNERQHLLYLELSDLHDIFAYFESCNTRERMLQFVRALSAFPLMESAMTEYALDQARKAGASKRKLASIREKTRVFCGDRTKWHQVRNKKPWDDGSKVTFNLSALLHQINKMAKWAGIGVQPGNIQTVEEQVDELMFETRLAILREDPLKLTGIDRYVEVFALWAAQKTPLPAPGTKKCPVA